MDIDIIRVKRIMSSFLILSFFSGLLLSCSSDQVKEYAPEPEKKEYELQKEFFELNINATFRGISVVNKNIVWISGSGGTFLRTVNGGADWTIDSITGAYDLDFRDIEAFNKDTAFVLSAGYPAKIYKTVDGGISWKEKYSNPDTSAFFDGFEFWNKKNGIAYGDPLDGYFLAVRTDDGGESWTRIPKERFPEMLDMEAGFAASGTGLAIQGDSKVWVGLGGRKARVFYSEDKGETWEVVETPILCGGQMKGIYSLAFRNEKEGIAVGGEYKNEKLPGSRAYTTDGGKTWQLGTGVDAYRSGSCYVKDNIYLTTGITGVDITGDGGKTWEDIDDENLICIEFDKQGTTGYATGRDGKVVKFVIQ